MRRVPHGSTEDGGFLFRALSPLQNREEGSKRVLFTNAQTTSSESRISEPAIGSRGHVVRPPAGVQERFGWDPRPDDPVIWSSRSGAEPIPVTSDEFEEVLCSAMTRAGIDPTRIRGKDVGV